MEKEGKTNYKKIISNVAAVLFLIYEGLYSLILSVWFIWAIAYFASSFNHITVADIMLALFLAGVFQIIPTVLTVIAGILNRKLLAVLGIIVALFFAITFLCFFLLSTSV